MVPTTNFLLKWIGGEIGEHRFDEHLAEVSLITRDAFEPSLPLSVVVHIDYRKAPLVVQRFGDIQRLVEQTPRPDGVGVFQERGPDRTLIQLLQERSQIQGQASAEMREKFAYYNLELEEVLIGTPKSARGDTKIDQILDQLRSRQVAEERIMTYAQQERAAKQERDLRQAEAIAAQQSKLTESEVAIAIQANQGRAEFQRSLQEASRIKALAEAEAERAARVGIGQAMAVEEQVRAYGGPVYQLTQQVLGRFAEAIEHSGADVVPKIVMGGAGSGQGSIMETMLTMLLSDRMLQATGQPGVASGPEVTAIKGQILQSIRRPLGNGSISEKST
jgi:uncharacterized membrane protein YqiK